MPLSRYGRYTFVLLSCGILLSACQKEPAKTDTENSPQSTPSSKQDGMSMGNPHPSPTLSSESRAVSGTITEALTADKFTYFQLDTGSEKLWITSPLAKIQSGDKVSVTVKSPILNFHSKSLNRDFDAIYFVSEVLADGKNSVMENSTMGMGSTTGSDATAKSPMGNMHMPDMSTGMAAKSGPVENIEKVQDGKTVAEILASKAELAGQAIRIRGKVISYTANMLGKNWIHLKDSSSDQDIILTTYNEVKPGDIIVAQGQLVVDKDYGNGLKYEILLEDVKITKE